MRYLKESLDYHDLEGQVEPKISVDEYSAKVGSDADIVTLAFIIKGKQASNDLVSWLERGYNFIIDADVSDGEIKPGKYVVFVEMKRRTSVPENIVEIVEDLETLTDLNIKDWTVTVNEQDYDCDVEQLKQVIILSPHEYRIEKETDLNEMRELSGVTPTKIYGKKDSLLKDFISKAGL
jgi:hypothetical protein